MFHVFHESLGRALPFARDTAVYWLINGHFAVFVFFVLSGDALSIGYVHSGKRFAIDSLALRRYTRLMIPVALSTALVFALMKLGATPNGAAGQRLGTSDWLGAFIPFAPTLVSFLRFVLIDVFFPLHVHSGPMTDYNPMLWTMSVEMTGSFVVFVFLYLSAALRHPTRVLAVVCFALIVYGSMYGLFFFGMLLTHARHQGLLARWRDQKVCAVASLISAPIILFVVGAVKWSPAVWSHANIVCACALVWCCYTAPSLLQFFRNRISRWFGEISFSLYLVHFSVLVSLTSWLVVSTRELDPPHLVVIGLSSIVASLLLAWVFVRAEKAILRAVDKRLLSSLRREAPEVPSALPKPG